jgi:lipoyl(octanoyl) transferase
MRTLEVRELGRIGYAEALELQNALESQRKRGEIGDQLLLLEHPHVLTLGRNGRQENVLVSRDRLEQLGIQFFENNRGGDITYHGPGQIVGYPIVDLREWKRDVVAYVRSLEEVIIRVLARYGVEGIRDAGATGVWTRLSDGQLADGQPARGAGQSAKVCAIGVHLSRWVTTHGFALNWTTDLRYFEYIVPCGLTRPVTSLEQLGVRISREEAQRAIVGEFARVFDYDPVAVRTAPALV